MIRLATAAAALLLAGATAAGAAAPTPADPAMAGWQHSVETQLDANLRAVGARRIARSEAGTVLVRLSADGQVTDVAMGKGTGVPALDREAVAAARAVRFPALPDGYAKRPMTVAMNVFFGTSDESIAQRVKASDTAAARTNARFAAARGAGNTQVATR
ncbi:MAG: energy transducer TonB [Sphingomonas fennica]